MKAPKAADRGPPRGRRPGRDRSAPDSAAFELAHYPFYLMNHAAGAYNAAMARALREVGMDQARWRILMILGEANPSSISAIARGAVMKLSTATRAVQRMQSEGLVTVALRKSDNRVREAFMTRKGEQALKRVRAVAANVFRHAAADLSAEDISTLNDLLRRIERSLSRSSFDTGP